MTKEQEALFLQEIRRAVVMGVESAIDMALYAATQDQFSRMNGADALRAFAQGMEIALK